MYQKLLESSTYIKRRIKSTPRIGIMLGTGLNKLLEKMEKEEVIDCSEIPNFPKVTPDKKVKLLFGSIQHVDICVLQGRFPYYEGYGLKEVTYPVYVMKQLGIDSIFFINSCGGINNNLGIGTLFIVTDFVNLGGNSCLIGPNDNRIGPRFVDMSEPYSKEYINKAKQIAHRLRIEPQQGVFGWVPGPYYETAAEIRVFKNLGIDAVGMSVVPETIAANHLGMKVLSICCVTNMATGIQRTKHSNDWVIEVAEKASTNLSEWIRNIILSI
ncbi:purine-nucleoside phosphorylase [Candidatus Epulonipiscium fishelsonii]|uniref:Purine-nucleoside phosphorylase n=1 Tax=Candidatus Epulonipiscium fishelsonii TaxID=77094 RepID=A0ACC8X7W1_9FIRM|nr:purine-nucleoside phosphorylase [Epulopiscium sp. SCG-D08WGA-EpuloA1]OON90157.1 MAG: purine-nucleoside phosphorylase [Epulopiscium sp. AS2M-Bin002]